MVWVASEIESKWETNFLYKSGNVQTFLEDRAPGDVSVENFVSGPLNPPSPEHADILVAPVDYQDFSFKLPSTVYHAQLPLVSISIGTRKNLIDLETSINCVSFQFEDRSLLSNPEKIIIPLYDEDGDDISFFVRGGLEHLQKNADLELQVFFRQGTQIGYNFGYDSGHQLPVGVKKLLTPQLKQYFSEFCDANPTVSEDLQKCLKSFYTDSIEGKNLPQLGSGDLTLMSMFYFATLVMSQIYNHIKA